MRQSFFQWMSIYPTYRVQKKCALLLFFPIYSSLYRIGFTVGEIDILIAALCLENGYTLVTNNTADFKNINGLYLADWTQAQL